MLYSPQLVVSGTAHAAALPGHPGPPMRHLRPINPLGQQAQSTYCQPAGTVYFDHRHWRGRLTHPEAHMRKALLIWLVFDVGTDVAFYGYIACKYLLAAY